MIQKYVEQLAEEIQNAAERKTNQAELNRKTASTSQDFQDNIAQVEEYINGPMYKLSAIVGIDAALLPADELLSDEQTGLLAPIMEILLNAFNFYPDFPQNNGKIVPSRLRYRAMREGWDNEQTIIDFGEIHIEYCSYKEEECPFPGYCTTCSEFNIHDGSETNSKINDTGFIPAIFNYCDRWCERCNFTGKCRTFEMVRELSEHPVIPEQSPETKIQDIEDRLAGSFPPGGYEDADPFIFSDPEDSEDPNDLFSIKNKSERHPVANLTHTYSKTSHLWLIAIAKTCRTEFTKWLATGIADQILNAIETVSWYHFFMYPKILRALSGHFEMEEDEFPADDMNGSAKVVLIAIDWSIEAFNVLERHLTTHGTEIIRFTELLKRLRNDIEKIFPDARSFIRPGLDE
jgi:hypothetical protein